MRTMVVAWLETGTRLRWAFQTNGFLDLGHGVDVNRLDKVLEFSNLLAQLVN